MSLADKVCLVTGGAGGLGKAIVEAFLDAGATVVVWDLNTALLEQCQQELGSKGKLQTVVANITDSATVEKLFANLLQTHGKLSVLVNNAGIMDKFDPAGDLEKDLWDRVLAVNLTAPFLLTKHAVNHMLERTPGGGSILNICSLASARGGTAGAAYTASKHGLLGLTRNTACHYAKKGIRCNAILPGGMVTNLSNNIMASGVNQEGMGVMMRVMATDPGMVDVAKIAKMCVWISSDDAAFLNGAEIAADNGFTAA